MGEVFQLNSSTPIATNLNLRSSDIPSQQLDMELVDLNKYSSFQTANSAYFDLNAHRQSTVDGMLQVHPGAGCWLVVHSFSGRLLERFASRSVAIKFAHRLANRWLEETQHNRGQAVRFRGIVHEQVANEFAHLATLRFDEDVFIYAPDFEHVTMLKLIAYQAFAYGFVDDSLAHYLLRPWIQQRLKGILGEQGNEAMWGRLGALASAATSCASRQLT
jgi:hypothetical protein